MIQAHTLAYLSELAAVLGGVARANESLRLAWSDRPWSDGTHLRARCRLDLRAPASDQRNLRNRGRLTTLDGIEVLL